MIKKAIVFDLDGTLLYTLKDLADSFNQVMINNGYNGYSTEQYRKFIGNGALNCIKDIVPETLVDEEYMKYLAEFKEIYRENCHNESYPYEKITGLLKSLKEKEIKLAVLSNKPHEFTLSCVNHYFEDNTFEIIMGSKQEFDLKPKPGSTKYIIEKLKVNPENTIFVGDSPVDILTAKNAGLKSVAVTWGYKTKQELIEAGAETIIDNPLELLKIL